MSSEIARTSTRLVTLTFYLTQEVYAGKLTWYP